MAARIVLFGATGLHRRARPRARWSRAGRSRCWRVAARNASQDACGRAGRPADRGRRRRRGRSHDRRALLAPGDVLVSTVGPFVRWGRPALRAALDAGAHYLDSTGEPPFIRTVFEDHDAAARAAGVGLLTAFGYDYVPGQPGRRPGAARGRRARRQRRHRLLRRRRRAAQRRHARIGGGDARRGRPTPSAAGAS